MRATAVLVLLAGALPAAFADCQNSVNGMTCSGDIYGTGSNLFCCPPSGNSCNVDQSGATTKCSDGSQGTPLGGSNNAAGMSTATDGGTASMSAVVGATGSDSGAATTAVSASDAAAATNSASASARAAVTSSASAAAVSSSANAATATSSARPGSTTSSARSEATAAVGVEAMVVAGALAGVAWEWVM